MSWAGGWSCLCWGVRAVNYQRLKPGPTPEGLKTTQVWTSTPHHNAQDPRIVLAIKPVWAVPVWTSRPTFAMPAPPTPSVGLVHVSRCPSPPKSTVLLPVSRASVRTASCAATDCVCPSLGAAGSTLAMAWCARQTRPASPIPGCVCQGVPRMRIVRVSSVMNRQASVSNAAPTPIVTTMRSATSPVTVGAWDVCRTRTAKATPGVWAADVWSAPRTPSVPKAVVWSTKADARAARRTRSVRTRFAKTTNVSNVEPRRTVPPAYAIPPPIPASSATETRIAPSLADADCPGDQFCQAETCVECRSTADCGVGVCVAGACVGCGSDADCTGGKVCDVAGNRCVECLSNTQCPQGEYCRTSDNTCVACTNDTHCPGRVCDETSGVCLDCVANADCAPQVCAPTNVCVECLSSADCGTGRVCSPQRTCVQCLVNQDCPASQVCSAARTCVECVANTDCPSGVCNNNVCQECSTNANCEAWEVCVAGSCQQTPTLNCFSDSDCPSGVCEEFFGMCECSGNSQCGPGESCDFFLFPPGLYCSNGT